MENLKLNKNMFKNTSTKPYYKFKLFKPLVLSKLLNDNKKW